MQLTSHSKKAIFLDKIAGVLLIRIQLKELARYARIATIAMLFTGFFISILITYYTNAVLFWSLIKVAAIIMMIGVIMTGSKYKNN